MEKKGKTLEEQQKEYTAKVKLKANKKIVPNLWAETNLKKK